MSFAQSMVAILRGEKIFAQLIVLPLIETSGAHRRDLAKIAHDAIARALGHDIEPQNMQMSAAVVNA